MKSDYLSNEEAAELIAALPYEYRSIIVLAIETGFRIGDLCAAKAYSVDLTERTLMLCEQKTKKWRTVELTNKALKALQGYAPELAKKLLLQKYLFEREPLTGMSRQTVWRWVNKEWARLHKDEKRTISPHSFRKLYAVNKRQAGVSLADIKRDLNHERIETTMLYALADLLHEAEAQEEYKISVPGT